MSLDKFKEHIAEDEVKSEEVVAEEVTTDEEFAQVVEAEEKSEEVVSEDVSEDDTTEEVAEAKKQTKESEMSDDEEEDEEEMSEAKVKEEDDMEDEEDGEEEEMEEQVELEVDVAEDVAAMFEGQDLSEEFKSKAVTVFEAAVAAKAKEHVAKVEEKRMASIAEEVDSFKEELTEKVDGYLDYVVEQWMKDNEIAIEKGLKAELVEDFLGGLKNLFMEHYIDVPEEKVDVLEEQATQIEELKAQLAEQIDAGVEQKKILDQFAAQEVIQSVTEGLALTEAEKVASLAEGIEFVDADQYREKLETIKESYFPKAKATGNPEDNVSETLVETTDAMAAYAQALSRMKK
jgi:hypothetical protein